MVPRPTATGLVLLALIGLIYWAAQWAAEQQAAAQTNYGYAFLGMMIAAVAISWPIAYFMLLGLTAERIAPSEVTAGVPFGVTVRLRNRGWLWPAGLIRVADDMPGDDRRTAREALLGILAPGDVKQLRYEARLTRRGQTLCRYVEVSTSLPFGLLSVRRRIPVRTAIRILPALGQPFHEVVRRSTTRRDDSDRATSGALLDPSPSDEVFGVREYRPGDSPRLIHWKGTARRSTLIIREFRRPTETAAVVLLDTRVGSRRQLYEAELAVSLAATLLRDATQIGLPVGLISPEHGLAIPPRMGERHLAAMMRALSRLRLRPEPDPAVDPTAAGALPPIIPTHRWMRGCQFWQVRADRTERPVRSARPLPISQSFGVSDYSVRMRLPTSLIGVR